MSTCQEAPEWSEIEGQCPEQDDELNPIYTGNYQLGRQEYGDEEEEEEIVERERVVEEGLEKAGESEWEADEERIEKTGGNIHIFC